MAKDKTYIILEAKTKEATAAVRGFDKDTEKAFDRMKQNARNASTGMGGSLQKLKQHWVAYSAGAVAAILIVRKASKAVMANIKEWINLSKVQEKAEITLASALKAAGEYTDSLNKRYQEFASSIQKVTTYGDEQVLGLMALIKNLGVSTDKVEEATKMAIGLATATDRDVKSMAQYVALAMQGEFTMLRRYIPALRTTTDATEELRIVQEFAARGFKVAQENTKSYSDSLAQLRNLWLDLKEKLGDVIIRNKAVLELIQRGKKYVTELNEQLVKWYENNQAIINQKTHEAIENIGTAAKETAKAIKEIYKFSKDVYNIWQKIGPFLKMSIQEITNPLKAWQTLLKQIRKDSEWEVSIGFRKPPVPPPPFDWEQYLPPAEIGISMDAYIKKAKEMAAIEYAPPFNWEQYLPPAEIDTSMDAYIAKAKEMAAIEYAPPFDYEQYITGYDDIGKKGKETFDNLKNAVTGWASTFSSQLTDMVWAADMSFKKILESFGRMITQMMIQKALVEPLLGFVFPAKAVAQGAAFNQGRMLPYARGGIVDRPTIFPMAGGAGLMGEKGPEAIMPLARTKSGDLGVKAEGGTTNIQINLLNQSGQQLEATQKGTRNEFDKAVIDVVITDLRTRRSLRNMIRSTI